MKRNGGNGLASAAYQAEFEPPDRLGRIEVRAAGSRSRATRTLPTPNTRSPGWLTKALGQAEFLGLRLDQDLQIVMARLQGNVRLVEQD